MLIRNRERICAVGSILRAADANTVVWGSGFISKSDAVRETPKEVCALRGQLSLSLMERSGIPCPDVLGDPALLTPFIWPEWRATFQKYRLGLIPHYVDRGHPLVTNLVRGWSDDVHIIDIRTGVQKVITQLTECEAIASSSLHGLILADAYSIPSVWIKFSEAICGSEFKFLDYYSATGGCRECVAITRETTARELMARSRRYPVHLSLRRLLSVCPFASDDAKVRFAARLP
ncbi:MAG: polysaccharide pyruvyl transferase family protein [Bacillota bacterium]